MSGFIHGFQESRRAKRLDRAAKMLRQKTATEEQRRVAYEEIENNPGAEAAEALLNRYDFTIEKTIADLEEKEWIHDLLIGWGEVVVEPVKAYLRRAAQIAWPVKILAALIPREELLEFLFLLMPEGDTIFDENSHQRAIEVLAQLGEFRDPRISHLAAGLLGDSDDDLKLAALAAIELQAGDEEREAVTAAFLAEEDNIRVRKRMLELFHAKGWSVESIRKEAEKLLPQGYFLSKNHVIKQRDY
ncbi:MAG: hypothetical protein A2284_11625 [Deltaproteobacteria bacterium RIFOXYA12_FULL_61_11]|nr:MAG: hypothetical protein A2284_11625 [Deltaproteobacteria bacterium RIFOXYA12_FULL_61_11]